MKFNDEGLSKKTWKSGATAWVFRYSFEGKRKELNLGNAKKIPLSVARKNLAVAKGLLAQGKDPAQVKSQKKQERKKQNEKKPEVLTFGNFYLDAIKTIAAVKLWRNKKHSMQWLTTIERYVVPSLGSMPLDSIGRNEIVNVLKPIWNTKNDTATKVRQRIEAIFSLAIMKGLYNHSNPATWKGNLEMLLPSPAKVKHKKHFTSMPYQELPKFMQMLWEDFSVGRALIIFTTLSASRVGETAPAKWSEFDFKKKVWNCPPERRKDGKPYPHRVPLSKKMEEILKRLDANKKQDSEFVFASIKGKGHISRETPRILIQRLSKTSATMHGMRSCFRDWCAENGIPDLLAEKSLMHTTGNQVVQAYQRSDLLEQRREVIERWSEFLLPDKD